MKTFKKKTGAILLAAILLVSGLMGCAGSTGGTEQQVQGSEKGSAEKAMGRYLEEDAPMPEGIIGINAMVKLEAGGIRLLGTGEDEKSSVWDSKDNGSTWEKEEKMSSALHNTSIGYINSAALSPKGDVFLLAYENGSPNPVSFYLNSSGELKEIKMDLGMLDLSGAGDGASASQSSSVTVEETQTGESDQETEAETQTGESDQETEAETQTEETERGTEAETQTGESNQATEAESQAGESDQGSEGGEVQSMEMKDMMNSLNFVAFSKDGKLFGSDFSGMIHQIEPDSGEILNTFGLGTSVVEIGLTDQMVITVGYSGEINFYDIETGEPAAGDEVLAEGLKEGLSESNLFVSGGIPILMMAGNEESTLYYCNSSGLYRHLMGGAVKEQLMDASLNSLGSPHILLNAMVPLEDNGFLIAATMNNSTKLLKYMYSKDTPSKPSKQLKLYSLYDNTEIRQAISMFQKENPNYFVSFEMGITEDNGVTVSDALKTLNTDIMGGKGPDVLILDGMPIRSYLDKGLLEDLSGVMDAIAKEDGLFEKIAGTYEKEGVIGAVPSRFKIPAIQSDPDTVKSATDLAAFAKRVEQLRQEDQEIKGIVDSQSPELLADKIYQSYSPAMLKEDGTLDEEKVKEYYTRLKQIYDTGNYTDQEQEGMSFTVSRAGGGFDFSGIDAGAFSYISGSNMKANIGVLDSITALADVLSGNKAVGNSEYGGLKLAGKNVYCPGVILGINSKGRQMEDAKKFVSYVFGKEIQSINQGGGFPVNRAAFSESLVNNSEDKKVISYYSSSNVATGEDYSLEVTWPEESALKELEAQVEDLDTPCITDSVIKEAVIEQAVKCLQGQATVEETTKTLMQKVNLYLAE